MAGHVFNWFKRQPRRQSKKRFSFRKLSILSPRTIAQVVALSLAFIVAPLVLALILASAYVDNVMRESQQAILFSTEGVRHSLTLAETLRGMERSARVYQIMGDANLLANYERLRAEFIHTVNRLYSLEIESSLKPPITYLLDREQQFHETISNTPPGSVEASAAIENFSELRNVTDVLIQKSSIAVEEKVNAMKEAGETARTALMVEAAVAVAAALVISLILIPRILNYARELDRSLQQLGGGDLEQPIRLKGPKDIRALGARLDWLREQLNLLESQKQHFLQHVSHELKTPLSSIREGACLLADEVTGDLNEEQREILQILQRNCEHLRRHIDSLLKFSAKMQPFQAIERHRINLKQQIIAVTREHTLQIRAKDLRVETELAPLSICEDTTQISTVLDNLISNAVKYSPQGGTISIRSYQRDGMAVVEVADQGPGVAPINRDRIFDAFYKVNDPDHPVEGSGLGLSIAKLYAKSHGGDIEIADTFEGALFRLYLPIEALLP